jgi:hypothetical protein
VQRDSNLAVRPLAEASAVLVLHADRVLPLLHETRVIKDEVRIGIIKKGAHLEPIALQQKGLVPPALVQPVLHRLDGIFHGARRRKLDPVNHRLDTLPVAVLE